MQVRVYPFGVAISYITLPLVWIGLAANVGVTGTIGLCFVGLAALLLALVVCSKEPWVTPLVRIFFIGAATILLAGSAFAFAPSGHQTVLLMSDLAAAGPSSQVTVSLPLCVYTMYYDIGCEEAVVPLDRIGSALGK